MQKYKKNDTVGFLFQNKYIFLQISEIETLLLVIKHHHSLSQAHPQTQVNLTVCFPVSPAPSRQTVACSSPVSSHSCADRLG